MQLIILSSVLMAMTGQSGGLMLIAGAFIGGILVSLMLRDAGIVGCITAGGAVVWLLCEFLLNIQIGGNILALIGTISMCAAAGSLIGLIVLLLMRLGKKQPDIQNNDTKE